MKLQNIIQKIILSCCLILLFVPAVKTKASTDFLKTKIITETNVVGVKAGYTVGTDDDALYKIIGNIIQTILTFLGIIFLVLILYSGYQWMMAGGNADAITEAKDRIVNATIGLAIILASYTIVYFIMKNIVGVTTETL